VNPPGIALDARGDSLRELDTRARLAQLARAGRTIELCIQLGGASPDVVTPAGDSLLMLAAYHGHASTVHALLALGADPGLRNARGLSPLAGAAFKGAIEVLDALVAWGVDVNESGPDGRTPLMWAAAFGRVAAVASLLGHGADPDRVDHSGFTALAHARTMQAHTVVTLLTRAA
jgi:hypothetical protein